MIYRTLADLCRYVVGFSASDLCRTKGFPAGLTTTVILALEFIKVLSDTLQRELARYALGEKIRALRQQKSLRLADIAGRAGISSSLLSKIERDQSIPSLVTLQSIARALDTELSDFFPRASTSLPAVTRSQDRISLPERPRARDAAFDFESLNFNAIEPTLSCYRAQFRKGTRSRSHAHAGFEFLFILSGVLEVTVKGEHHVLGPGDSMYFDAGVLHDYASKGNQTCTALAIILPTIPAVADLDSKKSRDSLRLRSKKFILSRVG